MAEKRSPPFILLLEDDPDDQFLFRELADGCFSEDHRLEVTDSPEEAARYLTEHTVDACYVDFRLGMMSGLDFIEQQARLHPEVAFLLLTGQGGRDVDEQALAIGAKEYLKKIDLSEENLSRSFRYAVSAVRHEASLRGQRQVVNNLLRSMGELLWIYDLERKTYFEVGEEIQDVIGLEAERVKRDASLWMQQVLEEDRPDRMNCFKGDVPSGHLYEIEYRIRDEQGQVRVMQERLMREWGPQGQDWLVGVTRNVTERHERQRQLRLFQDVIDQVEEAVLITDARVGKPGGPGIVYLNAGFTKMTGYTLEELKGKSPSVLHGEETDPLVLAELKDRLISGQDFTGETVNYRKDGTAYIVQWGISPVFDPNGEIVYFAAIQRDMTEERQHQEVKTRNQRLQALGELVGGVAHDLNNILSPVMIAAGLLQHADNPELRASLADTLTSSSKRAADLVGKLLAFARGGGSTRSLSDLREVLEEVYSIGKETFPREVKVQKKIDSDIWPVLCSPTEIQQVLLNLAINAKDSMEERGGDLVLGVSNRLVGEEEVMGVVGALKPGPYVVLTVQDQGEGIPSSRLDRIFDPFFSTKPAGKGTGLGLPSVLGILQAHGGGVQVDSRLRQGSCFTCYLPASPSEKLEEAQEEARIQDGQGQRILVVDDEPLVVELLSRGLETGGYQVVGVTMAAEALKLFSGDPGRFDAVITDVMMPEIDGLTLVRRLKELRPDLPILVMSGFVKHDKMDEILQEGCQAVLHKPVQLHEFLEAVGNLFS